PHPDRCGVAEINPQSCGSFPSVTAVVLTCAGYSRHRQLTVLACGAFAAARRATTAVGARRRRGGCYEGASGFLRSVPGGGCVLRRLDAGPAVLQRIPV